MVIEGPRDDPKGVPGNVPSFEPSDGPIGVPGVGSNYEVNCQQEQCQGGHQWTPQDTGQRLG